MVPSVFIYTGAARTAGGGAALPTTHPHCCQPTYATCLTEHTVGNGSDCQFGIPNLQFPKVHPLTEQMTVVLGKLHQEVQIRVRGENKLNCLTPGNGSVSVGSGMGHRCSFRLCISYHIRITVQGQRRSYPSGVLGQQHDGRQHTVP